jgi:hypothetical protein
MLRFVTFALAPIVAISVQVPTANACTACRAKPTDTLIAFSPIFAPNRAILTSYTMLGTDGKPLDPSLYDTLPPSSPDDSVLVGPPSFRARPGVSFRLLIDGRLLAIPQPLDITLVGSGRTHSIDVQSLNQQVVSDFSFDAPAQVLSLSAQGTKNILIQETQEESRLSYAFRGLQLQGSGSGGVFMRVFETKHSIVFREGHGNASTWEITLTRTTAKGSATFRATGVKVPPGGYLTVFYLSWEKAGGRPSLTVTNTPPKTKVTVVPLRKL